VKEFQEGIQKTLTESVYYQGGDEVTPSQLAVDLSIPLSNYQLGLG
jgi:hypothetical protein